MRLVRSTTLAACCFAAACGGGENSATSSAGSSNAGSGHTGRENVGGAGGSSVDSPSAPACALPAGVSAPASISGTVALINALPKPVTLSCFLEALPRPLGLYATRGTFSAQPAVGERSPRLFLFSDPLLMTVVPDGVGSHLLELGELQSETRSLKAEIEFPVLSALNESDPFARILYELDPTVTTCVFCHGQEARVPVGNVEGFVSRALRPAPFERVNLAFVAYEASVCDAAAEPERCALLKAIFGHGEVRDREFPETMPTFY